MNLFLRLVAESRACSSRDAFAILHRYCNSSRKVRNKAISTSSILRRFACIPEGQTILVLGKIVLGNRSYDRANLQNRRILCFSLSEPARKLLENEEVLYQVIPEMPDFQEGSLIFNRILQ